MAAVLLTAETSAINHPFTVFWNGKVSLKRGDIEIMEMKRLLRIYPIKHTIKDI